MQLQSSDPSAPLYVWWEWKTWIIAKALLLLSNFRDEVVEVKPAISPALYKYEGNANPNSLLELSDIFA